MRLPGFILILAGILIAAPVLGQQQLPGERVWIITSEGQRINGILERLPDKSLVLYNIQVGELHFRPDQIRQIEQIKPDKKAPESWFNPHYPYLQAIGPGGVGMDKGHFYLRNTSLDLYQMGLGMSDHFSVEAGFYVPIIELDTDVRAWYMPQAHFPLHGDHLRINAALLGVLMDGRNRFANVFLGILSAGNRYRYINAGIGLNSATQRATYSASGHLRINYAYSILGAYYSKEYWPFWGEATTTIGARFYGHRFAIESHLIASRDIWGNYKVLPMFNLTALLQRSYSRP